MKELENLDFIENPISNEKEYPKKIWETFDKLKVLDNYDKDGEECLSEVEDEAEYDGEGEGDIGDFIDIKELTDEERKQLEKQGFRFDLLEGEDDGEGEGEAEGEEEANAKAGEKREREDKPAENGGDNKRQKVDE